MVLWASVIWKHENVKKKKALQIMPKASQQAAFCSLVTVRVLTFKVIALSYTPNRQQGNKNHETWQGTFSTRKITSQNQTHHMSTHAKDVGILKSCCREPKGERAFELRRSQKSRLFLNTPMIPSVCMSWEPSLGKSCPSLAPIP